MSLVGLLKQVLVGAAVDVARKLLRVRPKPPPEPFMPWTPADSKRATDAARNAGHEAKK